MAADWRSLWKWSFNDMNSTVWLCLQTNKAASDNPTFLWTRIQTDKHAHLPKKYIYKSTFIFHNRAPMWALRLNHISKSQTHLFFMPATLPYWYLWSRGIDICSQKRGHFGVRRCFTLFAIKDWTAYESALRGLPSIPAHCRSPVERFKGKQVHTTSIKSRRSHIPVNNWTGNRL